MNVLSYFDGISTGMQILKELNLKTVKHILSGLCT
jgi:hypothetical protein